MDNLFSDFVLNGPSKKTSRLDPGDTENALLGCILADPDLMYELVGELSENDFYYFRNKLVYQAIIDLSDRGKAIDILTVSDWLDSNGHYKDGEISPVHLADLLSGAMSTLHWQSYAEIVKAASVRRQLVNVATEVAKMAWNSDAGPEEMLAKSTQMVVGLELASDNNGALCQSQRAIDTYFEFIETPLSERNSGVRTGITDVDRCIKGLKAGKVYMLAGRPGMGKSGAAYQIIRQAVADGFSPALFSLEVPERDVIARLAAQELRSVNRKFTVEYMMEGNFDEADIGTVLPVLTDIATWPLFIDDQPALTMETISARVRKAIALNGVDFVIIDHIGLTRASEGRGLYEQNTFKADFALRIAKEHNIPVLLLSQLSREIEKRGDKRPMLSDLRDSGAYEQNANAIIFLYRDGYYDPETDSPNVGEVIIAKNRDGRGGTVTTFWDGPFTMFLDAVVHTRPLNK